MSTPRPFGDGLCQAIRHYLHQNNKTHLGQINAEILSDLAERYFLHHEAQTKAKKKRGDATPEEREVYIAYPRHVAPQDAYLAIREALQRSSHEVLLSAAIRYRACVSRWPASYRFKEGRDTVPYPATWFRDGRWEDDEKEWMPAGMFQRDDDPKMDSHNGLVTHRSLSEPPGWKEEYPESIYATWQEVPQDSKAAICDHMNKVRA